MPMRYELKNRAKILIVDDDQTAMRVLGPILQEHGYEVATALSGKEALATAAFFAPDLLVSEVGMGLNGGIKAAVLIAAMLPGCRVLFLSAHASMSDVSETVPKNFVYSFTSKPLHPLDLLNAIDCMLPAANIST